MHLEHVRIEGFRLFGTGARALDLPLRPGLNVLVGENDAGKSAVVDAIRLALGTTSQEYLRVAEDDFHVEKGVVVNEIAIQCRFADIDKETGGALLEHLSYENGAVSLHVTFLATRNEGVSSRRRITVETRSGKDGTGPVLDVNARLFLQATYLRPLRDAERELAAGKNSRLSQILQHAKEIAEHKAEAFDPAVFVGAVQSQQEVAFPKGIANVSRLADHLIQENEGVKQAGRRLDSSYLANLNLGEEPLTSRVSVGSDATPDRQLRAVLEKLDLRLSTATDPEGHLPHGLGYNNLLFMACELLLLGQEQDTLPLLLIEEPEAHLHPQLQLRLIEFLQEQAGEAVGRHVQVLLTTHSPNLASKVKLASIILVCQGRAFPMGPEHTLLSSTDYRFLERFLDVTKANLFFARGVLIVEGDAEALILPTLARLLGCDLTRYGVSIVNVGSRGLRRYARIFRRKQEPNGAPAPSIPIKVACLADRDILPECARDPQTETASGKQRKSGPRFESDLQDEATRTRWNEAKRRNDGENVQTFVSDHWTLEYDLAFAGLPVIMSQAIALAKHEADEDRRSPESSVDERESVLKAALEAFGELKTRAEGRENSLEYVAFEVIRPLLGHLSKAMTAQHLASLLDERCPSPVTSTSRARLLLRTPKYIRDALQFVTGTVLPITEESHTEETVAQP